MRSWVAKGHRTATDIHNKTRNREENQDVPVVWAILGN